MPSPSRRGEFVRLVATGSRRHTECAYYYVSPYPTNAPFVPANASNANASGGVPADAIVAPA